MTQALDTVCAAVVVGDDPVATSQVALGIARAQARRRRAALADLLGEAAPLEALVPDGATYGLADGILYGVSIAKLAYQVESTPNLHILPSGAGPLDHEAIMRSERWLRLAEGVREVNAILLVVAPAKARGLESLAAAMDGVVAVGSVVVPPGLRLIVRVPAALAVQAPSRPRGRTPSTGSPVIAPPGSSGSEPGERVLTRPSGGSPAVVRQPPPGPDHDRLPLGAPVIVAPPSPPQVAPPAPPPVAPPPRWDPFGPSSQPGSVATAAAPMRVSASVPVIVPAAPSHAPVAPAAPAAPVTVARPMAPSAAAPMAAAPMVVAPRAVAPIASERSSAAVNVTAPGAVAPNVVAPSAVSAVPSLLSAPPFPRVASPFPHVASPFPHVASPLPHVAASAPAHSAAAPLPLPAAPSAAPAAHPIAAWPFATSGVGTPPPGWTPRISAPEPSPATMAAMAALNAGPRRETPTAPSPRAMGSAEPLRAVQIPHAKGTTFWAGISALALMMVALAVHLTGGSSDTKSPALFAIGADTLLNPDSIVPFDRPLATPVDTTPVAAFAVRLLGAESQTDANARLESMDAKLVPALTWMPEAGTGRNFLLVTGAYRDSASAESLMVFLRVRRQLPRGQGSVARLPYALLVQRGLAREQAPTFVRGYRLKGLPVYALMQEDGSATLYAGAFEKREQAAPLLAIFRAGGEVPSIALRTGRPL